MTKEKLAIEVIKRLKTAYPRTDCTLEYDEAWKLLVSVRLAAQCTDARVNVVVVDLFKKYPSIEALADADVSDIEEIVRPCGLGKSKARDISACMRMLRDDFGGLVPDNMTDLLKLPGVGRKSANLIMGDVYGRPAIVTDTHCIGFAPGILFAVVFGLIAYLMIMAQNTEFEYSYFDGELRFAKIKNKSRRKRLGIYSMESVAAIAPAGDRSVYNYENGNEFKKIDYTSGQNDVPYYDIVIKSPDENVLIKAELDDRFLTEVEKKYRSKVKRREE